MANYLYCSNPIGSQEVNNTVGAPFYVPYCDSGTYGFEVITEDALIAKFAQPTMDYEDFQYLSSAVLLIFVIAFGVKTIRRIINPT